MITKLIIYATILLFIVLGFFLTCIFMSKSSLKSDYDRMIDDEEQLAWINAHCKK